MNSSSSDITVVDFDTNIQEDSGNPENVKDTFIEIQRNSPDINVNISNPVPSIAEAVQKARDTFHRGVTKPISWRKEQLKAMLRMFEENRDLFLDALNKDLRKPRMEAGLIEVDFIINELIHTIYSFEDWAKPSKPSKAILQLLDDLTIYREPFGVVLIVGTWNFPFQLTLVPAAGAIAAGNAVVIKPSELSVVSTQLMTDLMRKYMDNEAIVIIEGGVQETTELLNIQFDYIFFTGSTTVGKLVYDAAAKFLTPVTLELGGKSPVYVDAAAPMLWSVKRIFWGKFTNAGQTCIAPDYVICTKETQTKLLNLASKVLNQWYGNDVQKTIDYARIINNRSFERLRALIDACQHKIAIGGRYDASDRFIEPTIMSNMTGDDAVMQEELFGPILPIVVVGDIGEAIEFINARGKPLVLHVFTENRKIIKRFVDETSSGCVNVNDALMNMPADTLPFGGVGSSGLGAYHGKFSFDTFSHHKGCHKRDLNFLSEYSLIFRYPPYSKFITTLIPALGRRRHFPIKFTAQRIGFVLGFAVCSALTQLWFMMKKDGDMILPLSIMNKTDEIIGKSIN